MARNTNVKCPPPGVNPELALTVTGLTTRITYNYVASQLFAPARPTKRPPAFPGRAASVGRSIRSSHRIFWCMFLFVTCWRGTHPTDLCSPLGCLLGWEGMNTFARREGSWPRILEQVTHEGADLRESMPFKEKTMPVDEARTPVTPVPVRPHFCGLVPFQAAFFWP